MIHDILTREFNVIYYMNNNKFINYKKVISISENDWENAENNKMSGLDVKISGINYMTDQYGRDFHHFCTIPYRFQDASRRQGSESPGA